MSTTSTSSETHGRRSLFALLPWAALAAGLGLAGGVTIAQGGGALAGWSPRPPVALAQETPPPGVPGISVLGEGTAEARPDATSLRLGVEVNAQTPAAALSQTRETTERVLQRLRDRGVPEADLQSTGLNVFRVQDGPPGPATPGTYRGHASIAVRVDDVSRAGALLDAAVQAGATSVEGLSLGLRDDAALRRQALAAAIRDAQPRAEAAAAAAGLRLGGVRSVVELASANPPRPLGGGAGDGIAPGELSVGVRVQVTYDVSR